MSREVEELKLATQGDAVVGWRAWRLRKRIVARDRERHTHTVAFWLQSLFSDYAEKDEWRPDRAPHAKCRSGNRPITRHQQPDVPHSACSCGYSAYKTLSGLVHDIGGRQFEGIVIGEVDLWGRVLVKVTELRSSFAFPRSAYILRNWWSWRSREPELVAESLAAYGVLAKSLHSREFFAAVDLGN